MLTSLLTVSLAIATGEPTTCAAGDAKVQANDLVTVAAGAGDFKTLVAAVKAAGLEDALRGTGPFTVFAPTDAAFAALPKGTLDSLLLPENREQLAGILKFHVVAGQKDAKCVVDCARLMTLHGQSLAVSMSDAGAMIGKARIVKTDVAASNGIIHVIDRVLLPSKRADIVDTAIGAGSFNTLIAAVQAAGLEEALRGAGPFTVFAPTDAAFAKLDPATLASLLKPENKEKLAAILKLHVVAASVLSTSVTASTNVKTLNGQEIMVEPKSGKVFVNGAQVTTADLMTENGVIHVIDTVLLPK